MNKKRIRMLAIFAGVILVFAGIIEIIVGTIIGNALAMSILIVVGTFSIFGFCGCIIYGLAPQISSLYEDSLADEYDEKHMHECCDCDYDDCDCDDCDCDDCNCDCESDCGCEDCDCKECDCEESDSDACKKTSEEEQTK